MRSNTSSVQAQKFSQRLQGPSDLKLEKTDVDSLTKSYVITERLKSSLHRIFCSFLCRKDKAEKHKMRAMDFFHDSLDIQNMFGNYLNLSLLIKILMTKQ